MFCAEAVIDWSCFGYLVSSEKLELLVLVKINELRKMGYVCQYAHSLLDAAHPQASCIFVIKEATEY